MAQSLLNVDLYQEAIVVTDKRPPQNHENTKRIYPREHRFSVQPLEKEQSQFGGFSRNYFWPDCDVEPTSPENINLTSLRFQSGASKVDPLHRSLCLSLIPIHFQTFPADFVSSPNRLTQPVQNVNVERATPPSQH